MAEDHGSLEFSDQARQRESSGSPAEGGAGRCELLVCQSGTLFFGLFADEAEGLARWKQPVPLPRAPAAVLGVVSVRGRFRTVIDPLALLDAGAAREPDRPIPGVLVLLRGDEQLALAADRAEQITMAHSDEVAAVPAGVRHGAPLMRGIYQCERGLVGVLDPAHIFDATLSGAERRRRRSRKDG